MQIDENADTSWLADTLPSRNTDGTHSQMPIVNLTEHMMH